MHHRAPTFFDLNIQLEKIAALNDFLPKLNTHVDWESENEQMNRTNEQWAHYIAFDLLSIGVLCHFIGRILPLFSPAFCSMLLLQKNLREFCAERNGKHPLKGCTIFLGEKFNHLCPDCRIITVLDNIDTLKSPKLTHTST